MPQFMVLVLGDEAAEQKLGPAETRSLMEAQSAYEQALRAASAFLDGERLRPSSEGRRVSRRDGQLRVEAGPFGEQALTSYHVIEAPALAAAVQLVEACPLPPGARLDVRPLVKGELRPDKTSERGRVFAFGVLGCAASEPAWSAVMDRIDEATHDQFPPERFRGGVRLQEPSRGRQVAAQGGRRAIFDGPFLESKEVIGGLFFMCMASLDEAVEWASQSGFVNDGTLEVRELWRS